MESIISFFAGIGVDFLSFMKFAGILLLGSLLVSGVFRFIFKKQTLLSQCVSSSIAIVFIYVVMVLIFTVVEELRFLITPLPFATISQDSIRFFSFSGADYTVIAAELLSMIILALLVSLTDTCVPKGKNLLSWMLFRVLTVTIGFMLHYAANWLFHKYLPMGIVTYAPVILLVIVLIMLLTGALKFLLGLILAAVNPLIAALYTFFFATVIGKQITKSVLTTAILSGLMVLLDKLEITALSLQPEALVAYIPFLLILTLVWFVVSKL